MLLAIDPGSSESAYVFLHDGKVVHHGKITNEAMRELVAHLKIRSDHFGLTEHLVIESTKPFAIPMKKGGAMFPSQVYDTAIWIGRFIEAWVMGYDTPYTLLDRRFVKQMLLGTPIGNDAQVREAVADYFGFGSPREAQGTKAKPGPLYGITTDRWQALAVAIAHIKSQALVQRAASK